jgi:D-alanyl-D-alanine carboxypeptidase
MNIIRLTRLSSLLVVLFWNAQGLGKPPSSPAAQQLANWLVAFDSADATVYPAFLQKNFPSGAALRTHDNGLRRNTAGFDLLKIEQESATKVLGLLQERAGDGLARIDLEVQATEPFCIVKLALEPVFERPVDLPLPHLSQTDLIVALRLRLQDASSAERFSGAVLLAENGKPIFQMAYGLADRERHRPNTLQTRFSIGSMNKMFTAVAALQLVQSGRLKLDDVLGKYLADYPNQELAAKVTIAELLNHTAGTGDIFGPEFNEHRLELRTLEDYVKLYGSRALRFEPGSRFEYSNYGFILLGRVIEKASGESYDDYIREHVYIPAGMSSTGSAPQDQPVEDRSVGYTKTDTGEWRQVAVFPAERGTSAGGGYSTVGDLLRFANALTENKLLDVHYTRLLTTGTVKTPLGWYGYGFEVRSMNGTTCVGHGGTSPGVNGELQICHDSRYTVVALANMDPPAAIRISDFVTSRLPAAGPK